jgi:DNA-entry nuclease
MKRALSARIIATVIALAVMLSVLLSLGGCVGRDRFDVWDIPPQMAEDTAYAVVNENIPLFTQRELQMRDFELYSRLDTLGRCGVAFACISPETMPVGEREDISSVTPSGWEYYGVSNNKTYDFIEDGYVYNRCHLIGYQLAGENANPANLVTGTRFMNIQGMLPFENAIAEYVRESGGSVIYRVTPIFKGLDALCQGVLMEAWSADDDGVSICFCIFAYNVQPGVYLNYFTGENIAK